MHQRSPCKPRPLLCLSMLGDKHTHTHTFTHTETQEGVAEQEMTRTDSELSLTVSYLSRLIWRDDRGGVERRRRRGGGLWEVERLA